MEKEIIQEKEKKEETQEKNKVKFEQVKEKPKALQKDIEEMHKKTKNKHKKSKNKIIPIIIIFAIISVCALVFSTIFALLNMGKEGIVSGISIKGIDVSGLKTDEVQAKIEALYNEKTSKEINVKYEDYETTINAEALEVKYEISKAVKEALKIGRSENIFQNNYEILNALINKKDIDVEMTLNEEIATKTIEDIGKNLPGIVVESGYYVENQKLTLTKGEAGIKIDTEKMLEKIKNNLQNIEISNDYINIPVIKATPAEIDVDKIHQEVYKEVQNAYYTKEPFTIYPEVEGVDFDVEAAKSMLQEEKEEYVIDLKITKPTVTTDQIGTEAFPDQLSTFRTNFDGGNTDRTTNLVLACSKINGKVLMPGETFSYNQTLGPRTTATGYKMAKVYSQGEVIDGIGGGICQISTTLYNAALRANLQIVERRNHQFVTSYAEAGMDATVVYGAIDFKFKNTRKYPIKIQASARNGVATVSLYGIKEEQEYTFSFKTKVVATLPTSTKYVDDNTLPVGTEKVKQNGATGKITETYMTKMLDGKIISTTLLSKDTYDAMQKIVLRGTKGATTNTTTQSQTTKPQEQTKPTQTAPTNQEKPTQTNNNTNTNTNTNGTTTTQTNKPATTETQNTNATKPTQTTQEKTKTDTTAKN